MNEEVKNTLLSRLADGKLPQADVNVTVDKESTTDLIIKVAVAVVAVVAFSVLIIKISK